ncbi:copper amine oxidase N-terminal domain-containing protein [Paenibacillus aquistagni]|uniref:Copper amine oxidase N-terminal domain-containing protein n=1 Tax=Paenibacillus aquistagni TaxID=1852522 RepID=A0A1X7JLR9_9BACL|nr:copper amine oxidase N-terminal domain-containing protein [Paenibacillus aquistagni]NMM54415.1 copper amine oxidase N-terminal domain-containing protein [Paenibacillus aquistagni]SMG29124.1 Copper amine oxidase N-terminal domain-containing protein [Paenibacillus aquistagni]
MIKKLSAIAIASLIASSMIYPYSALAKDTREAKAPQEQAASSQVRVETANGYITVNNHKIIDGKTFIPISELAKVLKVQVKWEASTHTVTVENDQATMKWYTITDRIKVNNKDVTITDLPKIFDSRTYVPLVLLRQVFQIQYSWDSATKTVTIVSPDADKE